MAEEDSHNVGDRSWEEEGSMVIIELPDGTQKTIDGIEVAFVPKGQAAA